MVYGVWCRVSHNKLFYFSDEGEAVTEWEDDLFEAVVSGEAVVECTESESLFVLVVRGVDDMSVPQGVIGEDEPSDGNKRVNEIKIGTVFALVGIHENKFVFMI